MKEKIVYEMREELIEQQGRVAKKAEGMTHGKENEHLNLNKMGVIKLPERSFPKMKV